MILSTKNTIIIGACIFLSLFPCTLTIILSNENVLKHNLTKGSIIQPRSITPSNTRTLNFSGYEWIVRDNLDALQGPGPNYFSNSTSNVWVDVLGRLHLKITESTSQWYCAEIYSVSHFGYGSYRFTIAPGFENLDENIVVGLFTYLNDTQEIDIEFARWGDQAAFNGQYVIQPYYKQGNINRFPMDPEGQNSTHQFDWCKNYIKFQSHLGTIGQNTSENLIEEWYYYGTDNPKPSTERVHMNLWLFQGQSPRDSNEAEVIIENFEYKSIACDETVPSMDPVLIAIGITIFIGLFGIASIFFVKKLRK